MNKTNLIVRDAMAAVAKDVRAPKAVRLGLVKPISSGPFDLEKCPRCGLIYEFMDEPCLDSLCPTSKLLKP